METSFSEVFSFNKARGFGDGKKKLNDWLPFLGVLTIALIVMCGAWRALFARDAVIRPESQGGMDTELRSFSSEEENARHSSYTQQDEDILANHQGYNDSVEDILATQQGYNDSVEGLVDTGLPPYYRLGKPIPDWDKQRALWLQQQQQHPGKQNYTEDGKPRLFMLTGSQPGRCKAPTGDYLLLRTFKNKVDYCRLHGVGIFYNVAILDEKMDSFWAKLPLVRAAMEAHPEAEWLWWVDADLVITDMEFEVPLERYEGYNLVVHGWESEVFEKRSVMGLNAGSFLVRNCGWTVRFLERWASMGPKGRVREEAGRVQSGLMKDRPAEYPGDDQAALIWFMVRERGVWGAKILLERSYNLNGYWVDLVGDMAAIAAEESDLAGNGAGGEAEPRPRRRRSFVTHFAGCQPCTGNRNPAFKAEDCFRHMQRALALADNQVLRPLGFRHPRLDTYGVQRLPPGRPPSP